MTITFSSGFQVFGDCYDPKRRNMGFGRRQSIVQPLPSMRTGHCILGLIGSFLVTSGTDHFLRLYDLRRVANEDKDSIQNYEYISDYFITPSPFVEKPNTRYAVLHSFSNNITAWDTVTGTKVGCSSVKFF